MLHICRSVYTRREFHSNGPNPDSSCSILCCVPFIGTALDSQICANCNEKCVFDLWSRALEGVKIECVGCDHDKMTLPLRATIRIHVSDNIPAVHVIFSPARINLCYTENFHPSCSSTNYGGARE